MATASVMRGAGQEVHPDEGTEQWLAGLRSRKQELLASIQVYFIPLSSSTVINLFVLLAYARACVPLSPAPFTSFPQLRMCIFCQSLFNS